MATSKSQALKDYWLGISAQANVLGHSLYINCDSHAFAGRIVDVEMDQYLVIEGCKWVFSTGALNAGKWDTAEDLPAGVWRVNIAKIESFGNLHRPMK